MKIYQALLYTFIVFAVGATFGAQMVRVAQKHEMQALNRENEAFQRNVEVLRASLYQCSAENDALRGIK